MSEFWGMIRTRSFPSPCLLQVTGALWARRHPSFAPALVACTHVSELDQSTSFVSTLSRCLYA